MNTPYNGYNIIKGDAITLMIFHQYQTNVDDVKMLIKGNSIILHYLSDHVVKIDYVEDDIIEKLQKEKTMDVWEVNPITGKIVENYQVRTY